MSDQYIEIPSRGSTFYGDPTSYTIDPTSNINGTINYGTGGNYIASGDSNILRVYAFKETPVGRVYSETYSESPNLVDNNSSQDYSISWTWDAVTGADGYRLYRYSPQLGFNYDYFIDVATADYADFGDEWGLATVLVPLPSTINDYGIAQYDYGSIAFSPDKYLSRLDGGTLFTFGASENEQLVVGMNPTTGQLDFVDQLGVRKTLYANLTASIMSTQNMTLSGTSSGGTFQGAVFKPNTMADKQIAYLINTGAIYGSSLFTWDYNNKYFGVGLSNPQYTAHIHDSAGNTTGLKVTNSVTGSGVGDGVDYGIDTGGGGLINVRENNYLRFATNATLFMQLGSTGCLGLGTSTAMTSTVGMLNIQPLAVGTKGVLVTGAVSQTANLFEGRNSAGSAVFQVGASGSISSASTIGGSNLSGTNTGDASFATFGATPIAAGASISGQVITLQPASASFGGGVSTTTQTFAGTKTFADVVVTTKIDTTTRTLKNSSGQNAVDWGSHVLNNTSGSATVDFTAKALKEGTTTRFTWGSTVSSIFDNAGNPSSVAVIIRGASGQGQSLLQFQSNTPTTLAAVDQSGLFTAGAGSTSTMGYGFTGDVNSGIYRVSAGNISHCSAGTERMRVGSNGVSFSTGAAATARVHLAAGTTTASTAPLKFTSGSLLTAAEAGAVEFLTDDYYATITTGTARKRYVLEDSVLTSGRVPFATTNGRLTDDSDMTFLTDTLTVTKVAAKAGTSGVSAKVGGRLTQNTTQTGNTAATLTDLFSYSVAGGTMAINGDTIRGKAAGTFSASISTDKQITVVFGATTIFDTGALAITAAGSWVLEYEIIRTGAATQKCNVSLTTSSGTLSAYASFAAASETLSSASLFKIKGRGTLASDVVGEMHAMEFVPAF